MTGALHKFVCIKIKNKKKFKMGVQDSLGNLEGGAGFLREFGRGVQDSLGNLEWGCRISYDS